MNYVNKTNRHLFLHLKQVKRPKKESMETQESGIPEKVSKMAIGVEGGFSSDIKKDEYDDFNEIVVIKGPDSWKSFPIGNKRCNFILKKIPSQVGKHFENKSFFCTDNTDVPMAIQMSAQAILKADSAIHKAEIDCAAGTWDGEKLQVSKYAKDLLQLDNGIKIPPKNWKCEKCDLTTNLWLNLTDGSILCGRKFFDGSGGNNHAVEHFQQVGYPLAVKLGKKSFIFLFFSTTF